MSAPAYVDVPRLGRGAPGWLLRAAVLATGSLVVAIPSTEGAMWGALFILGPAILASVYAPASPVPIAVVVGAALLAALTGDDPLRPAVLALIPAVHLFHLSCAIAGVVPVRARVHPKAFVRPAIRFVVVQAVVFAFVGAAALLPAGQTPALLEVVALAGLVVIAVVVALWHRQSKRQSDRHGRDDSHTEADGR
ncbi:MAG: hypothetical protein ACRDSK_19075 [Actinophytocola sp.]|uniref:hypothetical protein n=1 Tax=Actinophytocola sp. TaxID=1872138 RepID=UPI003D6B3734